MVALSSEHKDECPSAVHLAADAIIDAATEFDETISELTEGEWLVVFAGIIVAIREWDASGPKAKQLLDLIRSP